MIPVQTIERHSDHDQDLLNGNSNLDKQLISDQPSTLVPSGGELDSPALSRTIRRYNLAFAVTNLAVSLHCVTILKTESLNVL